MPAIAETYSQTKKRPLSDLLLPHAPPADGGGGSPGSSSSNKRQRYVRFDDDVAVLSAEENSKGDLELDEDDDVDFVISIGDDGDWDYTITTKAKEGGGGDDDDDVPPPPAERLKISPLARMRPGSPHAGCDRRLCEELYDIMMDSHQAAEEEEDQDIDDDEELSPPSRCSNSFCGGGGGCGGGLLGNNLKISITACNHDNSCGGDGDCKAAPIPLIPPPASPRRIRTYSIDGIASEEATICEWPCNLTVDNAITSALESAPLRLPPGSSCCA